MRRTLIAAILAVFAGPLCFPHSGFAEQNDKRISDFSHNVMSKIQNVNFEAIVQAFYFPDTYSEENRRSDREAIKTGLSELIEGQLGILIDFSSTETLSEKVFIISLASSSGLTQNAPGKYVMYKAEFYDFGSGYLIIGIHEEPKKLSIRNITICLPADNPRSEEIALNFADFMTNLATLQQDRKSLSLEKLPDSI